MPWTPGQSGNPKGRPPKTRALTQILEKAGRAGFTPPNQTKKQQRQKHLAAMLWDAAVTGEVTFPDGRKLVLDGDAWLGVVKFIYGQVDGPPKVSLLDIPDDAALSINFVKVEGRHASAPEDIGVEDEPADDAA